VHRIASIYTQPANAADSRNRYNRQS